MGTNRDFGTEGAGKGDADRTTDRDAYAAGFSEIALDGNVPGFRKVGLKQVKTYGKPPAQSEPVQLPPPEAKLFDGHNFSQSTWIAPTTDIHRE